MTRVKIADKEEFRARTHQSTSLLTIFLSHFQLSEIAIVNPRDKVPHGSRLPDGEISKRFFLKRRY